MPGEALLPLFLLVCLAGLGLVIAGLPGLPVGDNGKQVLGKPFGPAAALPDPAKGYNGWYLSKARVTEALFTLNFGCLSSPCCAGRSGTSPLAHNQQLIILKE